MILVRKSNNVKTPFPKDGHRKDTKNELTISSRFKPELTINSRLKCVNLLTFEHKKMDNYMKTI